MIGGRQHNEISRFQILFRKGGRWEGQFSIEKLELKGEQCMETKYKIMDL